LDHTNIEDMDEILNWLKLMIGFKCFKMK
jgi:hypothetical protein